MFEDLFDDLIEEELIEEELIEEEKHAWSTGLNDSVWSTGLNNSGSIWSNLWSQKILRDQSKSKLTV